MGALCTSQISHLLLYPSLWLLVPGLSSHFCHCYLVEMATRFCKLQEPLPLNQDIMHGHS